ncbi:hypothetical protein [Candidatus Coxiella mudrowiae]|uniref:hypothetical protein n=1 Tax=Candidatus Coxiella mudrowiae TaxID=2054173 RepID=UPI000C28DC42|nr:hypothetical protein [Candidatus Coxiella mudrowiae]
MFNEQSDPGKAFHSYRKSGIGDESNLTIEKILNHAYGKPLYKFLKIFNIYSYFARRYCTRQALKNLKWMSSEPLDTGYWILDTGYWCVIKSIIFLEGGIRRYNNLSL